MEKNKTNNKKASIFIVYIIGILALAGVLWLLLQLAISYKNNKHSQNTDAKSVIIPTEEPLVTPTIVPFSNSKLKTFVFTKPNIQYSFEYPSSWSVVEIGHDNIVRLNFVGHCKVEFSTKGSINNKGVSDQTKETKTYAGRTFDMATFSKNNIPYSETFSLTDATSKDGFSLVNVDLPSSNGTQCQQTVDLILSSLKFEK